MNYYRSLTEEAVRLLDIPDEPDIYHRIRRWARVHIKHESVAPIDTMNWPKGCLMCGLVYQARMKKGADNTVDRAASIYGMAAVQSHIDKWIAAEAPLYFVDDVLAGQALLMLADFYKDDDPETYMRYMKVADGIMKFLYDHDADAEGVLPYRPAQKTGQIFADSIGMIVPFAVLYGLMKQDDDAIGFARNQITYAMKHLADPEIGLPWHGYSLDEASAETGGADPEAKIYGALGWGRALGWIMYGLGASAWAFDLYPPKTPEAIRSSKTFTALLDQMSDIALQFRREDGLFGSIIHDPETPADTSASAMILYGIKQRDYRAERGVKRESYIDPILPYIGSDGKVKGAQGECMGIGQYSDTYGSYPWSVGMTMLLL